MLEYTTRASGKVLLIFWESTSPGLQGKEHISFGHKWAIEYHRALAGVEVNSHATYRGDRTGCILPACRLVIVAAAAAAKTRGGAR